MTLVSNDRDRKKLDSALKKLGTTLLLILDDAEAEAEFIHDKAEKVVALQTSRKVFLIKDVNLLTQEERIQWFESPGHYAVVGGKHKAVAIRGPISDLILSNDKPSPIEIRWAFQQGELLP